MTDTSGAGGAFLPSLYEPGPVTVTGTSGAASNTVNTSNNQTQGNQYTGAFSTLASDTATNSDYLAATADNQYAASLSNLGNAANANIAATAKGYGDSGVAAASGLTAPGSTFTHATGALADTASNQTGTGTWSGAAASQYLSPYLNTVLNASKAQYDTTNAQQQGALAAQNALGGSFGSSAQGGKALLFAQQGVGENAALATQLNAGYQNAQTMYTSDQARALQSQVANQQANITSNQYAATDALSAANAQVGANSAAASDAVSGQNAAVAGQSAAAQAALAGFTNATANLKMGTTSTTTNQNLGTTNNTQNSATAAVQQQQTPTGNQNNGGSADNSSSGGGTTDSSGGQGALVGLTGGVKGVSAPQTGGGTPAAPAAKDGQNGVNGVDSQNGGTPQTGGGTPQTGGGTPQTGGGTPQTGGGTPQTGGGTPQTPAEPGNGPALPGFGQVPTGATYTPDDSNNPGGGGTIVGADGKQYNVGDSGTITGPDGQVYDNTNGKLTPATTGLTSLQRDSSTGTAKGTVDGMNVTYNPSGKSMTLNNGQTECNYAFSNGQWTLATTTGLGQGGFTSVNGQVISDPATLAQLNGYASKVAGSSYAAPAAKADGGTVDDGSDVAAFAARLMKGKERHFAGGGYNSPYGTPDTSASYGTPDAAPATFGQIGLAGLRGTSAADFLTAPTKGVEAPSTMNFDANAAANDPISLLGAQWQNKALAALSSIPSTASAPAAKSALAAAAGQVAPGVLSAAANGYGALGDIAKNGLGLRLDPSDPIVQQALKMAQSYDSRAPGNLAAAFTMAAGQPGFASTRLGQGAVGAMNYLVGERNKQYEVAQKNAEGRLSAAQTAAQTTPAAFDSIDMASLNKASGADGDNAALNAALSGPKLQATRAATAASQMSTQLEAAKLPNAAAMSDAELERINWANSILHSDASTEDKLRAATIAQSQAGTRHSDAVTTGQNIDNQWAPKMKALQSIAMGQDVDKNTITLKTLDPRLAAELDTAKAHATIAQADAGVAVKMAAQRLLAAQQDNAGKEISLIFQPAQSAATLKSTEAAAANTGANTAAVEARLPYVAPLAKQELRRDTQTNNIQEATTPAAISAAGSNAVTAGNQATITGANAKRAESQAQANLDLTTAEGAKAVGATAYQEEERKRLAATTPAAISTANSGAVTAGNQATISGVTAKLAEPQAQANLGLTTAEGAKAVGALNYQEAERRRLESTTPAAISTANSGAVTAGNQAKISSIQADAQRDLTGAEVATSQANAVTAGAHAAGAPQLVANQVAQSGADASRAQTAAAIAAGGNNPVDTREADVQYGPAQKEASRQIDSVRNAKQALQGMTGNPNNLPATLQQWGQIGDTVGIKIPMGDAQGAASAVSAIRTALANTIGDVAGALHDNGVVSVGQKEVVIAKQAFMDPDATGDQLNRALDTLENMKSMDKVARERTYQQFHDAAGANGDASKFDWNAANSHNLAELSDDTFGGQGRGANPYFNSKIPADTAKAQAYMAAQIQKLTARQGAEFANTYVANLRQRVQSGDESAVLEAQRNFGRGIQNYMTRRQ